MHLLETENMIGTLKFRLSSRRHIPIISYEGNSTVAPFISNKEWYPYEFTSIAKTLLEARKWQAANDGVRIEHRKYGLLMLPGHAAILAHEWSVWERTYAPVSVTGKIVLDIGAGCGETAYFYFRKGARKIICVEPDPKAIQCLTENAARRSWNVEVVPELFKLDMLQQYRFDFMKMDGEGCEKDLLKLTKLPTASVIESHSLPLTSALVRQFGARVVAKLSSEISLLYVTGA
jgi:hypothetical protein